MPRERVKEPKYKRYKQNPKVLHVFNKKTGKWRRLHCVGFDVTERDIAVSFVAGKKRLTEWLSRAEWGIKDELPASFLNASKKPVVDGPLASPSLPPSTPPPPPSSAAPSPEDDEEPLTESEKAKLAGRPLPIVENPGDLKREMPNEYNVRAHANACEALADPMKVLALNAEIEKNYAVAEANRKLQQARARHVFSRIQMGGTGAVPDSGGE